jgi:hypothetical protein
LEAVIYEIIGIPDKALQGVPLSDFSVAMQMLWADKRETASYESPQDPSLWQ